MMTKIPTAKEFLARWLIENKVDVHGAMITYAKLHVKAALQAAADNVELSPYPYNSCSECGRSDMNINKNSILNSYPENLIV